MPVPIRRGASNSLYLQMLGALVIVGLLCFLLLQPPHRTPPPSVAETGSEPSAKSELFVYCAAGMRYPMERIAEQYEREYGVAVQLQYGGSNSLLSQIEVSQTGDLFLAAEESYIELARQKGLIQEVMPLAVMRPVMAVRRDNPKHIAGLADLLRDDVKVALANPDATAIGQITRELLTSLGTWAALEEHVTATGVFTPTVNEVANNVKLGSVDAGVVWDATAVQYDELSSITVPELQTGTANVEIAVLTSSRRPTEAIRFARYVSARDAGLQVFRQQHFQVVEGDLWEEQPQLTFYAGTVNRRALEPILTEFSEREGVTINTVYNGCGILTATMRTMRQNQDSGFPDVYMACDVYYLDTVRDWFQDDVNVSEADIVMVVKRGNPRGIHKLEDLLRPDVRVVLGHPDQCTIGVLSVRLLQEEGIYDRLIADKDIPMKPNSAMLIPDVITEAADATLAYVTDTRGEAEKVEVIRIDSPLAKAVQPYSIARSSDFKQLAHRLYDKISRSRGAFESAGFTWRLDSHGGSE